MKSFVQSIEFSSALSYARLKNFRMTFLQEDKFYLLRLPNDQLMYIDR